MGLVSNVLARDTSVEMIFDNHDCSGIERAVECTCCSGRPLPSQTGLDGYHSHWHSTSSYACIQNSIIFVVCFWTDFYLARRKCRYRNGESYSTCCILFVLKGVSEAMGSCLSEFKRLL